MRKPLLFTGYLLATAAMMPLLYAAQNQSQPNPPAASQSAKPQPATAANNQSATNQTEGERIFAANCSRCHTTPDGFSPRISGTVVMHMRVRANLSQHDETELLKFFNP